jgi:nitrogen fixation protein FixH
MTSQRPITGRMVLYGLLAFFGVIFTVNGIFVFYALDTWPGLRFDNAYERGINYNQILAKAKSQAAMKWRSAIDITQTQGSDYLITVRLSNENGAPLHDVSVSIELSRAVHEGDDASLKLRPLAPGIYQASHRFPLSGRWQAAIKARHANGQIYKMAYELMVES